MSDKKTPVKKSDTNASGGRPQVGPTDTKKGGTAPLPNINRAMILRLVETVKSL
jgi:hypothetical protein